MGNLNELEKQIKVCVHTVIIWPDNRPKSFEVLCKECNKVKRVSITPDHITVHNSIG